MIEDLRQFLAACQELGEVTEIHDADWHEEIGALTEATAELIDNPPALLFDRIKGYPAGYRVFALPLATHTRIAAALGIDPRKPKLEVLREASNRMNQAQSRPIPPVEVGTAPVMENVLKGDQIDMLKFPVPLYHSSDGGRYIGTGDSLINRDPESGFINMGTYRQQVHGRDLLGLWMSPGQQGRQICQKFWDRGLACPVVATYGTDPQVFFPSHTALPWGVCELDVAGGLRGAPVEVIPGPLTGLPIPARAEIAIEGEVPPPKVEAADEGPFGEWPGYYSGGTRGTGEQQPVIRIKALYHRNDPIIMSMPPLWPGAQEMGLDFKAALLWDQLESAGIQDVAGVWVHSRYLIVVAIRQRYAGHAKQAGMAVLGLNAIARNGRLVVIVDEDIDPSDLKEVLWAMETRVDPARDIEIVDGAWSTPLDPRMPLDKRDNKDHTNSRAIFYAVRPFTWKDKFPQTSRSPRELRRQVIEKYRDVLYPHRSP
ncbi:MAG TPA: UbiD family decarboxylase [Chloroflexota bacterium]|nr:UbiD family decarboxylase [Chloroflexota bacterium]